MRIERVYLNFTLMICLLVALYLITQNWKNQLVLQNVKVYDASLLTDGEVKTLADVQPGSPLYLLSLSKISSRVRQNPFVKVAIVVRALPYDLTITVHERDPLALLATPTTMFSVDDNGVVLPLPLGRRNSLPVITNLPDRFQVGDTVKGSIMQAVKFISDAKTFGAELSASIAEVRLAEDNLIAFTTASSLPVVIGKGNFERKLLYLQKFLTEVEGKANENYDYVDLRFDGQIVLGAQTGSDRSGMVRTSGKVN